MNRKRVLGLAVAFVMTATSGAYAAGFKDVKDSNWASESINRMSEKGYAGGFPDGTFRPGANISRAEFAAIINKINGFTEQEQTGFRDLSSSHWAYAEIRAAVKAGYAGGFPDGTFKPNLPVTREQAAAILNNIYKFENSAQSVTIKDLSKVSPWAADSVLRVVASGVMGGYEDGTFSPKKPVTRAECIVILDRIVQNQEKSEAEAEVKPETQPAVPPAGTVPSSGGGGGGGSSAGGSGHPSEQQVKESLSLVSQRLDGVVKNDLTTDLQKNTADRISDSVSKYIADSSYSISGDVEDAKSAISQMSSDEYKAFKNAITSNIPAKDLETLNKYFELKK